MQGKGASERNQSDYEKNSGRQRGGQAGGRVPFSLISIAAAFVICGVLLYFGYLSADEETEDKHWDVVAIGDSIIGKAQGEEAVEVYFEEYSGMTMLNGAFGGNGAAVGENAHRYSYNEESINLYQLARAACFRDYGIQRADLAASRTKVWYFDETMESLAAADLNQTEVLLIAFGFNDYTAGRKLDNPDDPMDIRTYGGALRYAIELFQETYPNLKIVLVTPTFCHIEGHEESCMTEDRGGGTLDEYAEKVTEVGAEYGVLVIDVFYGLGFNEANIGDYTEDGVHLNSEGRKLYARFLAEEIKELQGERME